jgi:spore germination cell wall hydrolase CwlJ-like protein
MKSFLFLVCASLLLLMTGCASVTPHRTTQAVLPAAQESVQQPSVVVPTQSPTVVTEAPVAPLTMPYSTADVECVAQAMYREARGEGDRGQFAVGYVVMNRKNSKDFPSTVCGVVYQGKREHMCQFSWVCKKDPKIDWKNYDHTKDLAKLVLLGVAPNPIGHRRYFRGVNERVRYRRRLASQVRVEHQMFYDYVASVP